MRSLRESILNKQNIADISRGSAESTKIQSTLEEIFVDFTIKNRKLFETNTPQVIRNYKDIKSIIFRFKPTYSKLLLHSFHELDEEIKRRLPNIQLDYITPPDFEKNKVSIMFLKDRRVDQLPKELQMRSDEFMRIQIVEHVKALYIIAREDSTLDVAIEKAYNKSK